jgi:hypothetical protein
MCLSVGDTCETVIGLAGKSSLLSIQPEKSPQSSYVSRWFWPKYREVSPGIAPVPYKQYAIYSEGIEA